MSEPLDLEAIRQRANRSHEEISALCSGERKWTMRIPAQPDRDSDLILAATVADVDTLIAEVERLRESIVRTRDYLRGKCRACGRPEESHREYCRLYVGPLIHTWVSTKWNGTFGGVDHYCRCGGWFRQGGSAGHGDGTENATPVCPNADQAYRGEPA